MQVRCSSGRDTFLWSSFLFPFRFSGGIKKRISAWYDSKVAEYTEFLWNSSGKYNLGRHSHRRPIPTLLFHLPYSSTSSTYSIFTTTPLPLHPLLLLLHLLLLYPPTHCFPSSTPPPHCRQLNQNTESRIFYRPCHYPAGSFHENDYPQRHLRRNIFLTSKKISSLSLSIFIYTQNITSHCLLISQ